MSDIIFRIVGSLCGRRAPPAPDMEHGRPDPTASAHGSMPHVAHDGRPQIRADDSLTLFRHITGIISDPSMVHTHLDEGGRAAPNLGIYARVVHNEQDAKRGYKRFSWLINSCLGLQIIVAAALTAMGAAGASHSAVTAFGAINTVIAGLLTFLKGSGLPNRLKYYQSEWKRVREFIEQRERDFSRPGCDLDVYGVINIVERMYDDVKADLEATVPDRFAGIRGGASAQKAAHDPSGINGDIKPLSTLLPRTGTNLFSEKLKEMESGFGDRAKDLAFDMAHKAHLDDAAEGVKRELQRQTETINDDAKALRERAEQVRRLGDDASKGLKEKVDRFEDLEGHVKTFEADATRGLNEQFRRLGDDASKGLEAQVHQVEDLEGQARTLESDATRALNEQVEQARQLEQRAQAMGESATQELGREVQRADHAESSFLAKLKELRSEIGNRAHLAQEAMHYLQAATHHRDANDAGGKDGEHQAEHGAGS